jgi:hypothetical protein
MKVQNSNSVDQYPDDYSNLEQSQQDAILTYFNTWQKKAENYYNKHVEDAETASNYLMIYNHTLDQLSGAKSLLQQVWGVMVEYNWPRDKGNWILATKEDWQEYEDSTEEECTVTSTTGYDAWPSPNYKN